MLTKTSCLRTRSNILQLAVLYDNSIAVVTQLQGIKLFSHHECQVMQTLSIELLGSNTTAVALNEDEKLIAFANNNIIYIVSLQSKILLQTIKTFEGKITLLSFIKKSKYLISGTSEGRVMQYRYDGGRSHLSRLCSFGQSSITSIKKLNNNYVSCFAFYENLFASSGYGGIITILKMNSYANKYNIEASKVRINALCFLDSSRIVSANMDGVVKIHTLKKYTQTKNISTPFTNINSILLMPHSDFILLSADAKNLILINTKLAKVVSTDYLSFHKNVSKITLTKDNTLLVVLESRELLRVELPTTELLKSYILHNSLEKAYELIEQDPMLQGTREHKRVEVMYEKQYAKAIEALIESKTKEARQFLRMFSEIKSKQKDINAIFKAFEFFPRFKNLYLDKKFALAYAMAEKHPALKYTKQYKKMEESFKEAFSFAQKQVLLGRDDLAKEILSPYATILVKRDLLHLILKQNREFLAFLKAIHEKKYATVEELAKRNEIFYQIPTYIELQKEIQRHLFQIKSFINSGNTQNAIDAIKELIYIPQLKDELQDLYRDAKVVQKLQEAYEIDDFVQCYELLDSDGDIEELELAQFLEKHWSKLINDAELYALKADAKGIKETLGILKNVKTRANKIGDLFRVSFQVRIKALLAKRNFRVAESIIYTYIDIFGHDREITQIMKTYEKIALKKLAITLEHEKRLPRDSWLNSSLIME